MSSEPIAWTSIPRPETKLSRHAFHQTLDEILAISRYFGLIIANSATIASTACSSLSSSTTSLIHPRASAVEASYFRQSIETSFARFSPTEIASRFVPPNTGALPIRTPVWPNLAVRTAIARSHATTNSFPPPAATPMTAAMTGTGAFRIASKSSRDPKNIDRSSIGSGFANCFRNPPAQKESPDPVMTRATESPRSASLIDEMISAHILKSYAFLRSGLFNLIHVASPRRAITTSAIYLSSTSS